MTLPLLYIDRKKANRLIPTLAGKTHDSRHIHLNTDETTPKRNEEERENIMHDIIMTQYELKTGLSKFKG